MCTHVLGNGEALRELGVEGGEQPFPLVVLALEAGQHQRQEGLVMRERRRGRVARGWCA